MQQKQLIAPSAFALAFNQAVQAVDDGASGVFINS